MSAIRQVKLSYLHPFIFILYAVAYVYVINIPHIDTQPLIVPLLLFELGAVIVLLTVSFMLRNMGLAAIFLSIVTILFFSYGRVYALIQQSVCDTSFIPCGKHRFLIIIWLMLIGLTFIGIRREPILPMVAPINRYLTLVTVFLVVVAGVRLAIYYVNRPDIPPARAHWIIDQERPVGQTPYPPPDIYYIILDEYTRADILMDYFGYDNSPFLEGLEARGFMIADQSRSNYARTFLSLASSLNMHYLDDGQDDTRVAVPDDGYVTYQIRDNAVAGFLKQHGYQYVHMNSRFPLTATNAYADHIVDPVVIAPGRELLYDTTMLPGLFAGTYSVFDISQTQAASIDGGFDLLATLPDFEPDTPKFVLAHFMSPHPPYVFEADGTVVPATSWRNDAGYIAQLQHTNDRVLELIDTLQAESDVQPIIIVQGDHGSNSSGALFEGRVNDKFIHERMAILNTYYLPGYEGDEWYESITPVNTFRLILDTYFGSSFGLLEDHGYISLTEPQLAFDLIPVY